MKLVNNYMNVTESKIRKEIKDIVRVASLGSLKIKKILDLGANVGLFSLYFAEMCPDAEIHSFEPVKSTFNIFKQNVKLNKFKNIHINNLGISSKNEQLELGIPHNRDEENIGLYSVLETRSNHAKAIQIGNFIKLKDYLVKNNIIGFDIIKMDIEGYELIVLEDNLDLFKHSRTVYLECVEKYYFDVIKIKKILKGMGYKYVMNSYGIPIQLVQNRTLDYFGNPEGLHRGYVGTHTDNEIWRK